MIFNLNIMQRHTILPTLFTPLQSQIQTVMLTILKRKVGCSDNYDDEDRHHKWNPSYGGLPRGCIWLMLSAQHDQLNEHYKPVV